MPEQSSEREIVERIEGIFSDTLSIAPPAPDVDIIEAALLDSLGLVTLLFEVEQELGVQMPLESLEVDDFRSVQRIAQLVARMQSSEQGENFKEAGGQASSRAGDGLVGADTEKSNKAPTGGAGDGPVVADTGEGAGT
jgi:methoxymalonate biosynthesis acyl carrier protein